MRFAPTHAAMGLKDFRQALAVPEENQVHLRRHEWIAGKLRENVEGILADGPGAAPKEVHVDLQEALVACIRLPHAKELWIAQQVTQETESLPLRRVRLCAKKELVVCFEEYSEVSLKECCSHLPLFAQQQRPERGERIKAHIHTRMLRERNKIRSNSCVEQGGIDLWVASAFTEHLEAVERGIDIIAPIQEHSQHLWPGAHVLGNLRLHAKARGKAKDRGENAWHLLALLEVERSETTKEAFGHAVT